MQGVTISERVYSQRVVKFCNEDWIRQNWFVKSFSGVKELASIDDDSHLIFVQSKPNNLKSAYVFSSAE